MTNAIRVITPYRYEGTWVFDDPAVDLVREPFVAGIPEMIDALLAEVVAGAERFRLVFSDKPFPGATLELLRDREEAEGWWYRVAQPAMEGWLCPALFKYFDAAPERLYAKAEPAGE
ncbi:MAG: DUF6717 family protein [Planctomycetota bacterium]